MDSRSPPWRGYAICTDARSGSTFLSRTLASTGMLGSPWEFFHERQRVRAIEADPALLGAMARDASSPNGIYGLKVFGPHFELAQRIDWPARLPELHFVHLVRRDLLGQAISLARALQTGTYKADQQQQRPPRYDRAAIADCLARLAHGAARWECYFARNGIAPLKLVYEDVVSDPQAAAEAVASHLGIAEAPIVRHERIELSVQRDEHSREWRARFMEDVGDRSYFDGGWLFSGRRGAGRVARLFLGPRRRRRG